MAEAIVVLANFQGVTIPHPHLCAGCQQQHVDKKLSACGRCRHHYYCSVKCQKEDWKQHKIMCCIKMNPSQRLEQLRQEIEREPLCKTSLEEVLHNNEVLQCSLELCQWNVEAACLLLSLVVTRSYTQLPRMIGSVGGIGKKNTINQFLGGLEVLFGWKIKGKRLHKLESLLGIKESVAAYLTEQEECEGRRLSCLATALPVVDKIYEGLRPMMFLVHLCYTTTGEIVGDRKRIRILNELLEATHRSCRENVKGISRVGNGSNPNWCIGRFLMLIDDCIRKHSDLRLSGYHVRRRKSFSTAQKIEQRFEWLRKQVNVAWKIYYQAMEELYSEEEMDEDWLKHIRARVMIQTQMHRRESEEAEGGRAPFSGKYDWVPNGWQLILDTPDV